MARTIYTCLMVLAVMTTITHDIQKCDASRHLLQSGPGLPSIPSTMPPLPTINPTIPAALPPIPSVPTNPTIPSALPKPSVPPTVSIPAIPAFPISIPAGVPKFALPPFSSIPTSFIPYIPFISTPPPSN